MRHPMTLFEDFDRGLISRRQLLYLLGAAMATRPATAFAQGSCGGARAGTPECNPTPGKRPFEPTGWKTVLLDHFSVQVADYKKEAAYYAALMNWKVRSDDGSKAVLDIGDWGGIVIRGGYQPPPPAAAPATPPPATPPGAGAAGAAGAQGGRGGGGGGRGTPRNAVFDSFCWGIEPWDTRKVEAELKKRGLNPVADHQGSDFQSFHVKDPGGFDLQISNGNRRNRRRDPAKASLGVPPPFESTNWQTLYLDHISYEVADYKANVAFYEALLGWKPGKDEGSQNQTQAGDMGGLIIRGGNSLSPAWVLGSAAATRATRMGHISFGITPFDPDAVRAELEKRGLNARVDTGGGGDIHTATYKSYHTTTPNGFDLQISNVTSRSQSGSA
jgi:catechol 2,3-dioxygenase-like lactoylglutathione lyase family enzyme